MFKKKLMITTLVGAMLMAAIFTGCSSKDPAPEQTPSTGQQDGGTTVPEDNAPLVGKVTAIDGKKITMALAADPAATELDFSGEEQVITVADDIDIAGVAVDSVIKVTMDKDTVTAVEVSK